MAMQHRGSNWTVNEEQRLLKLAEARKSWVFISANRKRPASSARGRLAFLMRQEIKAVFDCRSAESAAKAKSK
jgi:hypothetical protein